MRLPTSGLQVEQALWTGCSGLLFKMLHLEARIKQILVPLHPGLRHPS